MIRLSKKEDYAVILLNELARNFNKRLVPISEIAKNYSISVLFLRNLAYDLKNAGIIKASEGKSGGYSLAKKPGNLKMGEILNTFSKNKLLDCCEITVHNINNKSCPKIKNCLTGNAWRKLNSEFMDKIYNLSLSEFLNYNLK